MLLEKTKDVLVLDDEVGEKLLLHYDLLVDKVTSENKIGIETYGISITMFSENGAQSEQKAEFRDISIDEKKITDLLTCLIRNKVTPTSLPDIIEDFLAC